MYVAAIVLMAPAAATAQVALAGDIVDASGRVVDAAYKAMAAQFGKDAGIAYRYGPAPAAYGTTGNGVPTWHQRANIPFISNSQGGDRPCNPGHCGTWQVGGPYAFDKPGGYSSNFAHVAFTPDNPAQRIGVTGLATSNVSNEVFTQQPELSWALYGEGLDDVNSLIAKTSGLDTTSPVALGRCYGREGWCMSSIVVFQNGLISVSGNPTARNKATAQLAPGKVPTAIALSNSSEFAFITVWDTVNLRGEIAVVALVGLADGGTLANPDTHPATSVSADGSTSWWGEWHEAYPGLANIGNIAYMKVLGYMPLPADMKAPTEISVTTGKDFFDYGAAGTPGLHSPSDRTLSIEANRKELMAGGRYYKWTARAGVAVVVSKSEKKVAFIDLKPLYAYYESMYFTTRAKFDQTRQVGDGALWPFTFAAVPQQIPTVIKTVALAQKPTAVKVYQWGPAKYAWIATQDGQLQTWDMGGYPGAGTPAGIKPLGSVAVGRNPTGITFPTGKSGNKIYPDVLKELIIISRGDRKVSWVRFAGSVGTVVRTMRDSRLADPISAEDIGNNSVEYYLLAIADYAGKALHNYRYGPVIMHNYRIGCQPPNGCGMGPSGRDQFEYGGGFPLPGRAFHVTGANIP